MKAVKRQLRRVRDSSAVRAPTASMRPLPDFLIIGTQKGGTTSLHQYLAWHPQIVTSKVKEVHFFDRDVPESASWYRSHFPIVRGKDRTRVFEATPRYLHHPKAPERIAALLPDAQLIAVLRDPVERALSHYRMTSRRRETLPMFEAFQAEEERTAQPRTPEQADIDRDWYAYKARGRYAEQLQRYFEHIEREQILILRSEDLFADPASTCGEILEFLGLPALPPSVELPKRNPAKVDVDVPPEVRAYLEDHFAQPNRDLADLLGRELW